MSSSQEVAVSSIQLHTGSARWRLEGVQCFSTERNTAQCGSDEKKIESGPLLKLAGGEYGLVLYWGGTVGSDDDEISVWCRCFCDEHQLKSIMWRPQIALINQSGGDDHVWGSWDEGNARLAASANLLGAPHFMKRSKATSSTYLTNGAIILELRVKAWDLNVTTRRAQIATPVQPELTQALVEDFASLYKTGFGSDITVRALNSEGAPFKLHRLVLSARSPVFKRMLDSSSSMYESRPEAEIVLKDLEPSVASFFTEFIYTGKVAADAWTNDDALCHLLAAAHRYDVASLLTCCASRLTSRVSVENAADLLMVADLYDIKNLRAIALEFMCATHTRLASVQATESFKRLGQERPQLLLEIMAKLVPPARPKRSVAELASSLPTNLEALTVTHLKGLCSDRRLTTNGTKSDLIHRLRNYADS